MKTAQTSSAYSTGKGKEWIQLHAKCIGIQWQDKGCLLTVFSSCSIAHLVVAVVPICPCPRRSCHWAEGDAICVLANIIIQSCKSKCKSLFKNVSLSTWLGWAQVSSWSAKKVMKCLQKGFTVMTDFSTTPLCNVYKLSSPVFKLQWNTFA